MNTEQPTVSVIMPTHNRSAMLDRAVRSVLAQTYKDFELIIISDNSTDETDLMVASIKDPRIKFFRHECGKGASAARNTGIKNAKGKYIAFLDDDDEWTIDKLAVQVPVTEKSGPETGLVYAWSEYIENNKVKYLHNPELRGNVLYHMLDRQAIGACPTIIIKREVVNKIGFFDERLLRGNDGNYWRRISEHYHVDFVPKVLCRIHTGHLDRISIDSKKHLENAIFTLENRLRLFEKHFDKYPVKKAGVLAQLAGICFKSGKIRQGIGFLVLMFELRVSFLCKTGLLYRALRMLLASFFKKLLMCSCRKEHESS